MRMSLAWVLTTVTALAVSAGLALAGTASPTRVAIGDLLAAEEALHEGQFDEAERRVRRALKRQPELAAAHHLLGRIRLEQGRLQEAEAAFATAAGVLRAVDTARGGSPLSLRSAMLVAMLDRARAAQLTRDGSGRGGAAGAVTSAGDTLPG